MTEDQSRIRGERERDEQQTERINGGPQEEIENFLDDQSYGGIVVPDEDALQENGMVESAPDVLNGAEKQTE